MKRITRWIAMIASGASVFAAVEEPVDSCFQPAKPDALMGDWQGTPGFVAQVFPGGGGQYQANV